MPHAYPLYINNVRKHLAELTKYKKHNYEITQTIKNGFLFKLDFLHTAHIVDDKTRNYYPLFYGFPKTYILYLLPLSPPPKTSMHLSFP